ncbi:dUTP diphosphatase [Clostridium formicaceticum]|uniref:dUTPase n=1 Tax=Clostridium formicaceticum TaxID=1497 RepID=A0AAC9RQP8_9CLOT|nr:dUTP diphosphatase [Clostridium formicaceticum]AOY75229.1 dUTPase [Clostridium formicaceticum]ARE89662.1 dUTPase [Clostridium formicaceticum]
MDMQQLFAIQKQLDETILKNHQLYNKNLVPAKILALEVELGELANETRCFKFWSKKVSSPKAVVLEEFVDGLHFLLSIGLDKNFPVREFQIGTNDYDLSQQFQEVFKRSADFYQSLSQEDYIRLFEEFLTLGKKLDFTFEEIKEAYLAKNQINHQRQAEGY